MLHTINKSPYSHQCLVECLRVCATDDTVLLIEDGVYAALTGSEWTTQLLTKAAAVYVLQPDAAARGLTDRLAVEIKTVDYAGFVQLCCDQPNMLAWY
jgi:tRNA 2-thiouridine synthesizing protein B